MSKGMLGMLPLSAIRGPRDAFEEKLAGDDGPMWLAAFNRFLRKENPWATRLIRWTLTIGGKGKDALLTELEANGRKIGVYARSMVEHMSFTTAPEAYEVDLAVVAVAELGFTKRTTNRKIWCRAQELSLALCPPEVALYLRLAYGEQPANECFWVAMKQISDSCGFLSIFEVFHNGAELWLNANRAHPDDEWDPATLLVFVIPRK